MGAEQSVVGRRCTTECGGCCESRGADKKNLEMAPTFAAFVTPDLHLTVKPVQPRGMDVSFTKSSKVLTTPENMALMESRATNCCSIRPARVPCSRPCRSPGEAVCIHRGASSQQRLKRKLVAKRLRTQLRTLSPPRVGERLASLGHVTEGGEVTEGGCAGVDAGGCKGAGA